jgi:hypothetical protein
MLGIRLLLSLTYMKMRAEKDVTTEGAERAHLAASSRLACHIQWFLDETFQVR